MNIIRNNIEPKTVTSVVLLRATAVCLVVAYHLHFLNVNLPLGYLGVDIFFIISGYLVVPKMIAAIDSGSLFNYILRRVNRIYRPLFANTLFFLLFFFFFMPIKLVDKLTSQIPYALTSIYNLFLVVQDKDYFNQFQTPILHFWSLSVEIQFYIIFPIILIVLAKMFKNVNKWFFIHLLFGAFFTIFMLLNSFTFFAVPNKIIFYTLPFRLYEFLIGAIAWYITKNNKIRHIYILLFLVVATLTIGLNSSSYSLITSVFTFVFLVIGEHLPSYFAPKIVKFVADISYSMYLVHFPVVYFFSDLQETRRIEIHFLVILYLICILILSFLSYKYFELPTLTFSLISKKAFLGRIFINTSCLIILTLILKTLMVNLAYRQNYPMYAANEIRGCDVFSTHASNCVGNNSKMTVWKDEKPGVILIGDSFAGAIVKAVPLQFNSNYLQLGTALSTGCYLGKIAEDSRDVQCSDRLNSALRASQDKVLIIAYKWNSYTLVTRVFSILSESQFKPKQIIVVGNVPIFPDGTTFMQRNRLFFDEFYPKETLISEMDDSFTNINNLVKENSKRLKYVFLDPLSHFCNSLVCSRFNQSWLYFDADHLSIYGADLLSQDLSVIMDRFVPHS